jgi:hypothetical protein
MLIKALVNCIDFYYGTQVLNNDHQSFAKLHILLLWNSRFKQSSSMICLNCIEFYCGTQDLNNAHQSVAKLRRLLLWNSKIKQCTQSFA